ncbi:MAG: hypothetical protein WD827_06035 [Solirubrobacterales bacterium]
MLVYRLQPGGDGVDSAEQAKTVEILCARMRALGVSGAGVEPVGEGRIRVTLSEDSGVRREFVEAPGTLGFYDWEASLIGRERVLGGHPGRQPSAAAIAAAEAEWRAAGRNPRSLENAALLAAGAYPTVEAAVELASESGPTDAVVVSEAPVTERGLVDEEAEPGWYALRDDPALSNEDIVNPRQEIDEFGTPNVTFEFTEEGRRAFHEVTRTIAQRGQQGVVGSVSPEEAETLSGHFAVVFDDEVEVRPVVNFVDNPDGIDGRAGAQISGGFETVKEAREFAALLGTEPLPAPLVLVSRRGAD